MKDKLDALGHHEIIESLPVKDGRLVEFLGPHSLRGFRAAHLKTLRAMLKKKSSQTGRLHWLLGDEASARRELKRAPEDFKSLGYMGVLWMEKKPFLALHYFKRSLKLSKSWAWPYLWRAATRLGMGGKTQFQAALRDLDIFLELEPKNTTLALILRSLAYFNLKAFRETEKEAEILIAKSPHSCAGYGLRSAARWALGKKRAALEDFNRSKDCEPSGGFNLVDMILGSKGWKSESEHLKLLDAAIKKNPDLACLYAERAEVLRGKNFSRYDAALEDYRRAEALDPQRAWIQAQMSRAEGPVLGLKTAAQRMDRAAGLCSEAGWLWAWRGETSRLMKRHVQAEKDFDRALRKMPWYGYTYAWKGALLSSLGRWSEALNCLDAAVEMQTTYPTNALAFHARGQVRKALGDKVGAVEDITKAFFLDNKYQWVGTASKPATFAELARGIADLNTVLKTQPRNTAARAWRKWCELKMKA